MTFRALSIYCNALLALSILLAAQAVSAQTYDVTDLGTLPGGDSSIAFGINAHGEVVGNSTLPGNLYGHAFVYSNGALTDLGTIGGDWSDAFQINASGQITGYGPIADQSQRGYLFTNGAMNALPTLGGGFSDAYAINDLGQVVGASGTADGDTHPFLFSNDTMTDLGTLGSHGPAFWNTALGINHAGVVVGYSYDGSGN